MTKLRIYQQWGNDLQLQLTFSYLIALFYLLYFPSTRIIIHKESFDAWHIIIIAKVSQ